MTENMCYQKPAAAAPAGKTGYSGIAVLVVSTIFILGLGAAGILLSDILSLRREIRSGKAYENALATKITALKTARENLAKINIPTQGVINMTVPTNLTQAEILEEITSDAGRAGLFLTSLTFGDEETAGPVGQKNFQAVIEGSEASLIPFLKELNQGRLTNIKSLKYSRKSAEAAAEIAINLDACAYFYRGGNDEQ